MDKQISNIIFIKNRPLQLEGYLANLYRHFPTELIQTYILYKPQLFDQQYQQLFAELLPEPKLSHHLYAGESQKHNRSNQCGKNL